jgi:hypothetical protein
MISEKVRDFASWVTANLARYRNKPSDEVAEAIGDAILKVDQRLGVEVANQDEDKTTEVIITSYSDASLFSLVHQMVGLLPDVPGWNFGALKPPRGFKFTISINKHKLNVDGIEFSTIPDIVGGVQLLIPQALVENLPLGQDTEELAWLIVETGIGEELSSKLQHVEFSSSENVKDKKPITELQNFVMRSWGLE